MDRLSLCHQYHEYSKDDEIQESLEIGDLVLNDQIVATATENLSINTVWFVYVIDIKCVDHTSNNIDDYSQKGPKSKLHLLCKWPEKLNDNKKLLYIKEEKNTFIYKESIIYLFVEFETNYNKKAVFS